MGGVRARRLLRARQPDRDHRREPARPARRDDARLGPRRLRATARRPSAGTRSRSTATTSRRSTRPTARRPRTQGEPTVIVAQHGEGQGRHGGRGQAELARQGARRPRGGDRGARRRAQHRRRRGEARDRREPHRFEASGALELPTYELGEEVATRKAYGDALAALGAARGDVVALDGEVSNSTYAEIFRDAHPDRYFEMYIAEQQMVAAAVGHAGARAGCRSPRPSPRSSRAPTTSSAWPRSARRDIRLCGSHAGVSIGEDGPSQMALEDLAMMRAVHGRTVLYPCDAQPDGEARRRDGRPRRASSTCARRARRRRCSTAPDEEFPVGGSRVAARRRRRRRSSAAGITLHEALKAADALAGEGIDARVIDLYSVKPVDAETLRAAAEATGGRIVTVEDHWPEGGIGDAVLEALSDGETPARVVRLAVREHARLGQAGRAARRRRDRRRAHRRRRRARSSAPLSAAASRASGRARAAASRAAA